MFLYRYRLYTEAGASAGQLDPLANAEVCTRDAALMRQLGITVIYVDTLNSSLNHDDCFSIFNSVGIYITVTLASSIADFAYTTDAMTKIFQKIDAVKDYENLLAVELGSSQYGLESSDPTYAVLQNRYRVSSCMRT
jgi:1,3-beta-glucanosyltransferase GAS3